MKVLSTNSRALPLKNLEHQLSIVLSTKLFVLFSFFTLSFMIFQFFSPIVASNAETENTAKVSTPTGTISLATEDNVTINITPTPTQKIYSKTTALKITNSCKKGATITLSTNKSHNNLERQGADTLTKAIASITTTGNLTDNSWGYTLDNTNYSKVPTKDQSPAAIYNTTSATTSSTIPENLNLTYAVKTDDTIPSGTYTNDLVYTVNVKPECLQYTLKFNLDNGTGKPGAIYTDRQLSYGTKVNLADFTPTRTNYEFMGWIATTNNPAISSDTYDDDANIDINPTNEAEVTLTAKWKLKLKDIFTISNMQQMNPNICLASTTPLATATQLDTDGSHRGDPNYVPTVTLTDTRDNNTYTVSKLADGECWMTKNLRIIDKTITPADSNVTSNYTIPASSISGFGSNDTSNAYIDSNDGFYNWHTATAGTGTAALTVNGQNVPASICPKGWRLPTGGDTGEFKTLYNSYNSFSALTSSPVNITLTGVILNGSHHGRNVYSRYLTSTVYSSNYAYNLLVNNSSINPANYGNAHAGSSIRCIADNPTVHNISTMQQMTPKTCINTTVPFKTATQLDTDGSHRGDPNYVPTVTLTDARDNNTYTVSKLADGKCWMTKDLRIAGKTITPADSDVTSNYTIPASSINGFNYNNASNAYVNSDSGFYNWYTAAVGTSTQDLFHHGQNTTVSICPKGWRLPTGGNSGEFQALYNNYNSPLALRSSPVNLTLSGRVSSSSRDYQGSNGYYWSSTVYSDDDAYVLYLHTSVVYPAYHLERRLGLSVRCIAR